jgi:hypothetical protein
MSIDPETAKFFAVVGLVTCGGLLAYGCWRLIGWLRCFYEHDEAYVRSDGLLSVVCLRCGAREDVRRG